MGMERHPQHLAMVLLGQLGYGLKQNPPLVVLQQCCGPPSQNYWSATAAPMAFG
jgi:hypothetical protein